MNAFAFMKSLIRTVLVHALYYSGVLHLIKRRRLRGRAVILMYHRVLNERERSDSFSSDGIQVRPRTFERQLKFLRRHFNVVGPDEFVQRLDSGFADATCLITFDDGWQDNCTNALPLLHKHRLPAVIFLPTQFIGTDNCFWQERLARHLHHLHANRHHPAAAPIINAYRLEQVLAAEDSELKQRIHDFVRALKVRPDTEIQAMIDAIAKVTGGAAGNHPDRFLRWDEARTMANAGISFGSHAVTHRILTRLDRADVAHELTSSRDEIGRRLGVPVTLLAYPNGDCSPDTADAARAAGYAAAFTTQPGTVAATDNRYLLRRINIHDRPTRSRAGFYATVLGVL